MSGRGLVLDAGALISVENNPRGKVYGACRDLLETGNRALLPAVVLAQVWRASPRQAQLGVLRRMCQSVPFTDEMAEAVGRLLAASGTADVVDAAVVVAAISHGTAVLTSDPVDLRKLSDAVGVQVPLITV
ncbi:PIN domain-containing protein [Saccharopolyspora sp. WRP15-2]|uniref:PIN domain-containing protein n=1 Tax=Saccharopolyspora oryzae TaxID=2997343 RepID=A0ABT4V1N3_9PSEU|nr:PIN domain-containing protein [Saccharopolyspora oryzae]MDA3627885.1 PIN domain-containing protein [Saccharopolyspora oryzae]